VAKKSRTRRGAKRPASVTVSIDLSALEKLYKKRYEVSLDGDTKAGFVRALDGDTKGGLRIRDGDTKGGPRRPSKKRTPKKRSPKKKR
jgi:hypothetical protein